MSSISVSVSQYSHRHYTLRSEFMGYRTQTRKVWWVKSRRGSKSSSVWKPIPNRWTRWWWAKAKPVNTWAGNAYICNQHESDTRDWLSIMCRCFSKNEAEYHRCGQWEWAVLLVFPYEGWKRKRIGLFIDGQPMNDNSDFIDINDIRWKWSIAFEIYKGIVPAKFGGSAVGGAVMPSHSDAFIIANKMEKENFLLEGLDLDWQSVCLYQLSFYWYRFSSHTLGRYALSGGFKIRWRNREMGIIVGE